MSMMSAIVFRRFFAQSSSQQALVNSAIWKTDNSRILKTDNNGNQNFQKTNFGHQSSLGSKQGLDLKPLTRSDPPLARSDHPFPRSDHPFVRSDHLVSDQDIVHCTNNKSTSETSSPDVDRKRSDRPTEEELESVAARLVYHLSHFYIHNVDYSLFRPDIIHENRITGKTTVGMEAYFRDLSFQKIYGHVRFAFVRCGCLSYSTHVETGVVKIRWQISGMGMLRMVILYLPKQLYKKENMIKNATIVSEGISHYYVDGYKKVYRQITDNKEEDKEDTKVPLTDKIKEKVKNLAPNPAAI